MFQSQCQICKKYPASHILKVKEGGKVKIVGVCEFDYFQSLKQNKYAAPVDSRFFGYVG